MTRNDSNYEPVIIIGAPRSGTNLLRDTLCQLTGFGTWPCDEINYVWRHHNVFYPSDELPVSRARPEVQRYIQRKFHAIADRQQVTYVVEKTCANSLRIPFVQHVLPDAKFVVIVRDGVDAVASAIKRWQAPLDLGYILQKARFVPLTDLPYYATRYLGNRLYRIFGRQQRLAFWGPKLDGMDDLLREHDLAEVCALQWKRCVDKTLAATATLQPRQVHQLRYEDLVVAPAEEIRRICHFLQTDNPSNELDYRHISQSSVGAGARGLKPDTLKRIQTAIGNTQRELGYE